VIPANSHPRLLEAVLTVHAGALVHVGLGDVGASAGGDALFDALADKAAHEEGAALDAPVGLGVPGDPLFVGQRRPLYLGVFVTAFYSSR
jgi:hypothetical protein